MLKRAVLFISILFSLVVHSQNALLVYGPYLQMAGKTSIRVNWHTDTTCSSIVKLGLIKTNLNQTAGSFSLTKQHSVFLGGLTPDTKYFYSVTNSTSTFVTDTFYFFTAPANNKKIRIVATGDCGTGMVTQTNTKGAIMNFVQNKYVNCWLILGDNAYENGLANEYANLFFAPYQNNFIMHNTALYPCIGNHDYANNTINAENKNVAYYSIFNVPTTGELGGLSSGTASYYSYNYANVHFISIDSYGTEQSLKVYDTLSPQYVWLKQDLSQNNLMWTVVYFHHPPYTMGNHTSDWEGDLVNVRTYLTPLFERSKVDLVLNGHSHVLERSWLMKGHTGAEATFGKPTHAKDSSSARYDGTSNSCPYIKDTINNKGVVYAVCGSSGKVTGIQPSYPHDAMYYSNNTKGMATVIEVDANRMDAFFIGEDSVVYDKFTIFKNIQKVTLINSISPQAITLTASWNGNYNWSHNTIKTKQNTLPAFSNSVIIVTDSLNCFADTFKIYHFINAIKNHTFTNNKIKIYPNPTTGIITIDFEEKITVKKILIVSINGEQTTLHNFEIKDKSIEVILPKLIPGQYIIKLITPTRVIQDKIILSD
ncbi:MAG: metallophosphoesterase [Bacteroidetes bacterium]|nr:metallophosphoesterase [Bacteroidota bacterium]